MAITSLSGKSNAMTKSDSKPIGFLQFFKSSSYIKTKTKVIKNIFIINTTDSKPIFCKYQNPIYNFCIGSSIQERAPPFKNNYTPYSFLTISLIKKMLYGSIAVASY